MSNYGYVVLERSVSNEKLAADLNEINSLLHNALRIEANWDKITPEGGECIIVGFGDNTLFQLWRESKESKFSKRTLHTDHRWSPAAYWIEQVIFQFLANKYGGYMWDDGCGDSLEDRWYPEQNYPLTYAGYFARSYSKVAPYERGKYIFDLETGISHYGLPDILKGELEPWDDPKPDA